jgi:hypothetical protein
MKSCNGLRVYSGRQSRTNHGPEIGIPVRKLANVVVYLAVNVGDPDPEGTEAGALLELIANGRPEGTNEALCLSALLT